jgi:hypothetical protein
LCRCLLDIQETKQYEVQITQYNITAWVLFIFLLFSLSAFYTLIFSFLFYQLTALISRDFVGLLQFRLVISCSYYFPLRLGSRPPSRNSYEETLVSRFQRSIPSQDTSSRIAALLFHLGLLLPFTSGAASMTVSGTAR